MIPIRDSNPSKNYPIVNTIFIVLNVFFFMVEMTMGADLNRFLFYYGLVPARYSIPELSIHFSAFEQVLPFLSFMFLHGGFWHLLGNMWFLYIFGDNVEDELGHLRYILFYLLCGWASGLTHFVFNFHSEVPTIGASGAIAGVMGAYLLLYPRARVLTLVPIIFIPYFFEIPAAFFLGVWFLFQFVSAAFSDPNAAGIAWWAHVGGFFFGMVFLKVFHYIPASGMSARIGHSTIRRTTPRLHVVKPARGGNGAAMYGTIAITPEEAKRGVKKHISLPFGFRKRVIRVVIPPGVTDGTTLRLSGIKSGNDDEGATDAFLKILVRAER